ncbi:MAG: hypothetical protein EB127_07645 [Alphaproteobacteria bacterium]|nr:hypothetical protein [Alphaproteobacteria bacterium]
MALYVSFNDSKVDPTYASADEALLVSGSDNADNNPCVNGDPISVPVMPKGYEEIVTYANLIGWGVGYDNDGQLILYTGASSPE